MCKSSFLWCRLAQRAPSSPSLDETRTSAARKKETVQGSLIRAQGINRREGAGRRPVKIIIHLDALEKCML